MKTLVAILTSVVLTFAVIYCKADAYYYKANLQDGLVFQMEINSKHLSDPDAFSKTYHPDKIHHLHYVWYQFGNYDTYAEAKTEHQKLASRYTGMSLAAFFNKSRISVPYAQILDRMREIAMNPNLQVNSVSNITTEEVNHMIEVQKTGKNYTYGLVIPVRNVNDVDKILDLNVSLKVQKLNTKASIFILGDFSSPEEALDLRLKLVANGIRQVHMVACLDH